MTRLEKTLTDVIPKQLKNYGWGSCTAPSTYEVGDIRGLHAAAGTLRYVLKEMGERLYYRGQSKSHAAGIVPSLYRGAQTIEERRLRDNKVANAISTIKSKANWDPIGSPAQSEALAQHYGLRTRWVDVLDHLQTAAWFAYDRKDDAEREGDVGYIYMIAVPEDSNRSVSDLRECGSNWVRPHVQQGFGIATDAQAPDLNDCVVATFVLPRQLLYRVSNYDFYTRDVIYPPPGQDQGRYFWSQAAEALKNELTEADFELLVWSDGK